MSVLYSLTQKSLFNGYIVPLNAQNDRHSSILLNKKKTTFKMEEKKRKKRKGQQCTEVT